MRNERFHDIDRNPTGAQPRNDLAGFERRRHDRFQRSFVLIETWVNQRSSFGVIQLFANVAGQIVLRRLDTATRQDVNQTFECFLDILARLAGDLADEVEPWFAKAIQTKQ